MTIPSDALTWRKSTFSTDKDSCVEVAHSGDDTLVRDSKDAGKGPVLRFTPTEWEAFTAGVVAGEFG